MSQVLVNKYMSQLLEALAPAIASEDMATMQAALQAQTPAIH